MVRVFILIVMAFFIPAFAFAQGPAPALFFQTIPDMPLMAGLEELPDQTVIFEKPAGRIIDAAATVDDTLPSADVLAFYRDTLPQLGWTPAPKDGAQGERFIRAGEEITLEIESHNGHRFLAIAVRPLLPNH